jgi:hypothetical protein
VGRNAVCLYPKTQDHPGIDVREPAHIHHVNQCGRADTAPDSFWMRRCSG